MGSAVLILRSDGCNLAVTAGHVLDHVTPLPLLTLGTPESGLVQLSYSTAVTSQPGRPNRQHDSVDLAAFALDSTTTDRLLAKGVSFFPEKNIRHDWSAAGIYVAVAFPHSRNAVKRRKNPNDPTKRPFGRYVIPNSAVFAPCTAAPDDQYGTVAADLELNFVVAFRHQQVRDTEGNVYPHPRGMSGGAIYRIGTNDTLTKANEIQLVAIGTEYHEKKGLLVAASAPALRRIALAVERVGSSAIGDRADSTGC